MLHRRSWFRGLSIDRSRFRADRDLQFRAAAEGLEPRTLLSGIATLATFGGANGSHPAAGLILANGILYGTTTQGGASGNGEVFSLPVSGGTPTVLASFNGTDGADPTGGLIVVGATLFGTTVDGGVNNAGEVFSLPITGGTPTVLASFNVADGENPDGTLAVSGSTLFGTTEVGGANGQGAVFSLPIAGGTPTVLASFNVTDGQEPRGDLLLSGSTLFGTTVSGGANGDGEVFSLPITGGAPTVLASFNVTNGLNPTGGLILSGSTLFGTTVVGGANDSGEIFSLPITGGTPTVLTSFTSGNRPDAGPFISGSTLIGTSPSGGPTSQGDIFSVPITGGTPTILASFNGADGDAPEGALALDSSGNIFGATFGGGDSQSHGTVYELPPAASVVPSAGIGSLDPAFGVGGIASHNVGFTATSGLAVQPDGKSVIAGIIGAPGSEQFGLTRYNADGSLDTGFGTNGIASVSFQGTNDSPSSVALLPTGQILEAGTSTVAAGGSDFAVALFDANGTLDTAFGNGAGKVLTSFDSGSTDIANAIVPGRGGEFFVIGSSTAGGAGNDFAIAAYNADGTPATGFGTSGQTTLNFQGGDDSANAAVIQANGELVVAGSTQNPATGVTSIALVRLLPNGAIDSHFGTKGKIITSIGGVDDEATSVALQPRGQIVVGGESATGSFVAGTLASNFAVLRYTSAGKTDRTFNRSGFVITSFGEDAAVTRVLVQSDGKIVASGKTATGFGGASLGIAVARYDTNGTLDRTFNSTGRTLITLTGQSATASLQRPDVIAPSDGQDALRQQFEAFVSNAQGIVAATPGGDLAVAGNSGGFTEEGELIAVGIDLATSLLAKLPASLKAGASVSITISVLEAGTTTTGSVVTVELFLSPSGGAGDITLFSKSQLIKLKPRQAKSFKIKIKIPSSTTAGNYQLVAEADTGATRDLNLLNNIVSKGPFAIVG